MITGLEAFVLDGQLASKASLSGAVVGVSGELIAASGVDALAAAAKADGYSLVAVFDGPGRNKPGHPTGLALISLVDELRAKEISFQIAPAFAAAQLAYLYRTGFVTHIAGSHEALLFGSVPLVLDLVGKPSVLPPGRLAAALRMAEPQVVEVLLGAGCALLPDHCPLLEANLNHVNAAAKLAAAGSGSLYRAVAQYDQSYVPLIQTALATINWQPILTEDGTVELSNPRKLPLPSDLAALIGRRLPDLYYAYLSRGNVSPELLHALVWGWLVDDNAYARESATRSADYQKVQKVLGPLRAAAIAQLTQPINRYFQFSEVIDRSSGGVGKLTRERLGFAPRLEPLDREALAKQVATRTRELAGVSSPGELLAKAGVDASPSLEASATLALRWLAEAVYVNLMATGAGNEEISLPYGPNTSS